MPKLRRRASAVEGDCPMCGTVSILDLCAVCGDWGCVEPPNACLHVVPLRDTADGEYWCADCRDHGGIILDASDGGERDGQ